MKNNKILALWYLTLFKYNIIFKNGDIFSKRKKKIVDIYFLQLLVMDWEMKKENVAR